MAVSGAAGAGAVAGRHRHPRRTWRVLLPHRHLPAGQPGPDPDFLAGRQALAELSTNSPWPALSRPSNFLSREKEVGWAGQARPWRRRVLRAAPDWISRPKSL